MQTKKPQLKIDDGKRITRKASCKEKNGNKNRKKCLNLKEQSTKLYSML